jgi:hypothetical protein
MSLLSQCELGKQIVWRTNRLIGVCSVKLTIPSIEQLSVAVHPPRFEQYSLLHSQVLIPIGFEFGTNELKPLNACQS